MSNGEKHYKLAIPIFEYGKLGQVTYIEIFGLKVFMKVGNRYLIFGFYI